MNLSFIVENRIRVVCLLCSVPDFIRLDSCPYISTFLNDLAELDFSFAFNHIFSKRLMAWRVVAIVLDFCFLGGEKSGGGLTITSPCRGWGLMMGCIYFWLKNFLTF